MYQVDSATAATTLPTPAGVGPNPNGFFTNGNPGVVAATVVDQDILNAIMLEIANAVKASGQTLSKTNQSQLAAATQTLAGSYGVDSGTTNALAVTLSPVPANLAALTGAPVRVKVNVTNTGAATININGLGATAIQNADGSALTAKQLLAGGVFTLVYTGSVFVLQTVSGQLLSVQFPSSLAGNGWKKIPDPNSPSGYLIEQWGISPVIAGGSQSNITLPLAFPNSFYNAVAAVAATGGSTSASSAGIYLVTNSQLTIYNLGVNSGQFYWRALGT